MFAHDVIIWSPNSKFLGSASDNATRWSENRSLLINDGKCVGINLGRVDQNISVDMAATLTTSIKKKYKTSG